MRYIESILKALMSCFGCAKAQFLPKTFAFFKMQAKEEMMFSQLSAATHFSNSEKKKSTGLCNSKQTKIFDLIFAGKDKEGRGK